MVKCCPKPKQISARQLRILEKKAKSLQRPARLPPSPRVKKRTYIRHSHYDVTLARKKQAKVKTRLVVMRRAETEASLAFSAITEEIPLIDIIKRERNLFYMPQAPVPLFFPMTPSPSMGKPANGASENVICTPLELGHSVVPPNTPNEGPESPEPLPSTTPALASSPCDLRTADRTVDCGPALDGALQDVSSVYVVHPSPHVEATVDNPSLCRRSSSLSPLQEAVVLSQLPIEQELDSVVLPRVLLPKGLPLLDASPKEKVAVMDSPDRSLMSSIWAQPVELSAVKTQPDLPEAGYHRSLMSSIWAQPADLSVVKAQPDLRGALHVHHPNSNINIRTELVSVQECKIEQCTIQGKDLVDNRTQSTDPFSRNFGVQDRPGRAHIPQSTRPEFVFKPNVHVVNVRGNSRSSRRVLDGYKSGYSLGTDDTLGAFANAILRRTGHLGEKSISPENAHLSNPLLLMLKSAPKIKQDCIQQAHGKSRLLNHFSFQSTRNEDLQSRAPATLPGPTRSDSRTLPPPASAAIIKDDPLRRPSVRPTRKRLISVGRVTTYNTTTSKEEQACARQASNDAPRSESPSTVPVVQRTTQVKPKDSPRHCTTGADSRIRSKRRWAKLVVSDDHEICHNVSMESTASPPSYRNTYDTQTPVGTSLAHVTGGTIKQRVTTTLRAVCNRLWA